MGERIQWVAAMLFSLAFVALLSTMNSSVLHYGANVNNRVNNQLVVSESYELQSFDDTLVTGDTVRSAIKNQDTIYTNKLAITVNGQSYSASSNVNNISLTQTYRASIVRNTNNIITGISFRNA